METVKETWRESSPTQAIRATPSVWAAVRAVHARWQLEEPRLKIAMTANRLLAYALQHVEDVERQVLSQKEMHT